MSSTKNINLSNVQNSSFWVCTSPFLQTTLFLIPDIFKDEKNTKFSSELKLYDPDGEIINEVSVESHSNQISIHELDNLMASCKLESGMKYAHLEVKSPKNVKHYCRFHTREGACFVGEPDHVSERQGTFFPVTFAQERSTFIALVNRSTKTSNVRCRLYCGKRTPETICNVPALGSRVISLSAVFPEYAVVESGNVVPGYVRVTANTEEAVGAQIVEKIQGKQESCVFRSVM